MATRIDKKVSQNPSIVGNYPALQSYLLRRGGRKLNDIKYEGLLRNNALSDIEDSGEALTNVLTYITKIDDATEINIYGKYKPEDYAITKDFVSNEITSSFLRPLKDVSLAGGLAGATVSITPRIRIEDRSDQINVFTGKGSFNNLHAGPTALFYRIPAGVDQEFGLLKFGTYNTSTGVVSLESGSGGDIEVYADQLDSFNAQVAQPIPLTWNLKGYYRVYDDPDTGNEVIEEISLAGLDVSITGTIVSSYVDNGNTVYVRQFQATDTQSKVKLNSIRDILGQTNFLALYYVFSRDYSISNPPQWFLESPNDSGPDVPYSADDVNPETSSAILEFDKGQFSLYSEKEYFASGDYVETRIAPEFRGVYAGNNVTKDSNIRFMRPPRVLRDNIDNWGVRWDGYLRLDYTVDSKYIFEIETNTAIKIDIVNGGTNADPQWTEVFNSIDTTKSAQFLSEPDRYISKVSFNLDNLPSRFTYKLDSAGTNVYRYVPISIRVWNGGIDKAQPELPVENEPNLFIKVGESGSAPNAISRFYSGEVEVQVTEQSPNIIITPAVGSAIDLKAIIQDGSASVIYQLVEFTQTVTTVTGEQSDGTPITSVISTSVPIAAEDITLSVTSNVIYATALPTRGSGTYILRITPNRDSFGRSELWSSRILTPKDGYNGYADLLDINHEASVYRLSFDQKPSWWKVSEGNRYFVDDPISKTNDPLDGFVVNTFQSQFRSLANGIGLYGNGAGVYTSRPNLILGEVAYGSDTDSSNYIGMRLGPNALGEGGIVKFTGIPINNALYDSVEALGANDLGGSPNHQTIVANNISSKVVQLYWQGGAPITIKRFYLHSNLTTVTISDDPATTYGFPAFSSEADWSKPITINAVATATNQAFTTDVAGFVAPLVLTVERVKYNTLTDTFPADQTSALVTNEVWLLAFGTTFTPAQATGTVVGGIVGGGLSGRFVRYFLEKDVAFQFAKVDSGESVSFSDVLKVTYDTGNFISSLSEVPKVPSERVTPFGYDKPAYTSGICYPPYTISDVLLSSVAREDADLYNTTLSPIGNYDVIWGNHTLSDLGGTKLNITEKLEFSYSTTENPANIITTSSKTLNDTDYTHRVKIEFPIFKADGSSFDEDVYVHIGNQEKVKDTYYLFVNGRQTPTNTSSPILTGLS